MGIEEALKNSPSEGIRVVFRFSDGKKISHTFGR